MAVGAVAAEAPLSSELGVGVEMLPSIGGSKATDAASLNRLPNPPSLEPTFIRTHVVLA